MLLLLFLVVLSKYFWNSDDEGPSADQTLAVLERTWLVEGWGSLILSSFTVCNRGSYHYPTNRRHDQAFQGRGRGRVSLSLSLKWYQSISEFQIIAKISSLHPGAWNVLVWLLQTWCQHKTEVPFESLHRTHPLAVWAISTQVTK